MKKEINQVEVAEISVSLMDKAEATSQIGNETINRPAKYSRKPPMELINGYTGEMKCRVCGSVHYASIKPRSNGHYYRGSWQCLYGCKIIIETT